VPPRASLTDVVPRRSLVIIAAVVAIAVIATVLIVSFGGGSDPGTDEGTAAVPSTSSGASVPQGGGKAGAPGKSTAPGASSGASAPEGKPSDTPGGTSGDGAGDAGDTGKPGGLPVGYAMVTDRQFHFTMAMPEGFRKLGIAGENSGGKYSENGGFPRIQVDYTNSPTNNAKLAWTLLEKQTRGTFQQYQRVSIKTVQYNGYPTVADWQFKQTLDGERVRALDRGFKVDSTHGYAIVITCKDSEWNSAQCRTMRETAFATFKPTG
jgi:eukaryotic-like serine/threonine-protein kinase